MTPRQNALVAVMMACGLLVVGQLYATIPLTAWIAARHGVTPPVAALTGSAFGLAYAAGFLVFGPLSDRLGRGRVILGGLLALATATALVGLASGFAMLLAARVLQGLAAAAFAPAGLALMAEALPAPSRPLGLAALAFSFLASAPAAQLVVGAIAHHGLPAAMLGAAPLILATALLLGAVLGQAALNRPASAAAAGPVPSPARDRAILACWATAPAVMFAFVGLQSGLQALGGSLPLAPSLLHVLLLPGLLAGFLAGPMAARIGAIRTAQLGLAAIGAGLLLSLLNRSWTLGLGVLLCAAGVALAVTGLIAAVSARAAAPRRGLAISVLTFALFIGASLAPPIATRLAGGGPMPVFLLPAVFALLGAGMLQLASRPG